MIANFSFTNLHLLFIIIITITSYGLEVILSNVHTPRVCSKNNPNNQEPVRISMEGVIGMMNRKSYPIDLLLSKQSHSRHHVWPGLIHLVTTGGSQIDSGECLI